MSVRGGLFAGWQIRTGLLLVAVSVLAGCGESRQARPTGKVKGIVTYKGKPVTVGSVYFYGSDNQACSAPLKEDGSYDATGVPLGLVQIAVVTPPAPAGIAKAAKDAPQGKRFGRGKPIVAPSQDVVSVPAQYSIPGKSGLTLNVSQGTQSFDIKLP